MSEGRLLREGKWVLDNFAQNFYKYTIIPEDNYRITMTGSNVTTPLYISFPHRLNKICLTHRDASDDLNTDMLDIELSRATGKHFPAKFSDIPFQDESIDQSRITVFLGETYEYEPSTYSFRLSSTSGHFVYPVIYVQALGRR